MIVFPKTLQYVPVSTTTSPVTQTADVEVNKAFINEVDSPENVLIGSIRKMVPIIIILKKLSTNICAGFSPLAFIVVKFMLPPIA
jgi:hypothetical protein